MSDAPGLAKPLPPQPFRQGERLYLRAVERTDVPRLTRWLNDHDVNRFLLNGRTPLNESREAEWVERLYKDQSEVVFMIALGADDKTIGVCGLHAIHWIDRITTLGLLIGERDEWGKGYGKEATRLLVDYAFDDLNLRRVELSVYDRNERARKIYDDLGFIVEGRLLERRFRDGRYLDEILMALTRDLYHAAQKRAAAGGSVSSQRKKAPRS